MDVAAPATAFAPGRVNVVGEHTDYNGGLALAFAIEQGITVTVGAGAPSASAFVRGVLSELGVDPDVAVTVESDLPAGAGLSSSAALCVATVLAAHGATGRGSAEPLETARLCRRVENEHAGVPTGLLDQLASLLGRDGQGVLIDFGDETWEHVPLRTGGARFAVIPSGVARTLAATGYADRRAECEAGHPDRLRHVETENARVFRALGALRAGDMRIVGRVLDDSHASLRDDFEASVPAVEDAVAAARKAGAVGARMMGGGFGGSVLALFPPEAAVPVDAVTVRPASGARLL